MKILKHTTAKASYYNARPGRYDEFNENNSRAINRWANGMLVDAGQVYQLWLSNREAFAAVSSLTARTKIDGADKK